MTYPEQFPLRKAQVGGHKRSGYGTGGVPYTFDDMQADKLVVMRSTNW